MTIPGELFGDGTRLPDGEWARHGYEVLALYDRPARGGDGDGVISPSDAVWGKLRLWVDRNHDAKMTADESYALGEQHVVQISMSYITMSAAQNYGRDAEGNAHLLQGSYFRRSSNRSVVRAMHDVYFRRKLLP